MHVHLAPVRAEGVAATHGFEGRRPRPRRPHPPRCTGGAHPAAGAARPRRRRAARGAPRVRRRGSRGVRLRIATGGTAGEYFRLGRALAQVWQERLGPDDGAGGAAHQRLTGERDPAGHRCRGGRGQPARRRRGPDRGQLVAARAGRGLQRRPADRRPGGLADPRGRRPARRPGVASGPENSGVAYVAQRVLAAVGLAGPDDVRRSRARPRRLGGRAARGRRRRVLLGRRAADDHRHRSRRRPCRCACSTSNRCSTRCASATRSTRPAPCSPAPTGSRTRSRRCWCATSCWSTPALDADLVEALTGALFADQQRLADATQAARTVDAALGDPHPARPPARRRAALVLRRRDGLTGA